jgi:hypothetical protein
MFFNFALKYASRRAQENHDGLELIETRQILVYSDDVSIVRETIDAMKKNTETRLNATKEVVWK